MQDLNEKPDEKNPDEEEEREEAFQETEWVDITEGFSVRQQKKVNFLQNPK